MASPSRRLAPVLLVLLGGTAACTALLGDFDVGAGGPAGADAGSPEAGTVSPDGGPGDSDAAVARDAGGDGGELPPPPDGAFVSLLTFASTNTSPPSNMRVAYGPNGSLFILFAFQVPTTVKGVTLNPVGAFDIGLAKLAPNGQLAWVKGYGGTAYDYPGGLGVDANGDVYISGATEGTSIDFGLASGALQRKSSRYLPWIAKIDGGSGTVVNAISVDTAGAHQGGLCQAIAVRQNRIAALCNMYAPAQFPTVQNTTVTVAPPDGASPSTGFVVASLDPGLKAFWANGFGSDGQDFGATVAFAPNDDVVFAANVQGVAAAGSRFSDTRASVSVNMPTPGAPVLGRLAAATGDAAWARPLTVDANAGITVNGAVVDPGVPGGRVLVVGGVSSTVGIGNQKTLSTSGQMDAFLAALSVNDGQTIEGYSFGGTLQDEGRAIAIDRWRSPVVAGTYQSAGLSLQGKSLPDPLSGAQSGFVFRSAPELQTFWAAGFPTGSASTFLQAWSVASDPITGRVASAGVFKGIINFGDGNPVRSLGDGSGYSVWVVERRP